MSSSKMQKISECEVDRLSSLSDSILHHILSFLSTKDLMVTLFLSRYAHLWRNVQNLSFNQCQYHNCRDPELNVEEYDEKLLSLIHNVLIHNESSQIHEFHLSFHFCMLRPFYYGEGSDKISKQKRMASEIGSWVQFAIRKSVKILCLDLKGCGRLEPGAKYVLPNIVLSSNGLTELKLAACDIKPRGKIHLKSLKTLSLGYTTTLNDETMEEILIGCPLLEDLSLIDFAGLSTLNLTNPKLRKLKLFLGELCKKLKISCPYLISLEVAGRIELADLVKAGSVADASLDFSLVLILERRGYGAVKTLLKNLSTSKVLKVCGWCIMVFTVLKFQNIQWPSFSWKGLVVERTPLSKWHLPGLLSVLRNSLKLESLTIYISSDQGSEKYMLEQVAVIVGGARKQRNPEKREEKLGKDRGKARK